MKVQIINRFLPICLVFLWILGCDSEGPITGYRAISITNGTINFDGKDRTYVLQDPSSYDGTAAVPLVIGLHGHAPAANGLGFIEMGLSLVELKLLRTKIDLVMMLECCL